MLINPPNPGKYAFSGTVTGAEIGSEPQSVGSVTVTIKRLVGGEVVSPNKVELLTPLISLGLASSLAVVASLALIRRKRL